MYLVWESQCFIFIRRNSVDDAAVLRQELVSVQRLMDQLTQEKEKQVEELNVKLKEMQETLESKQRREEELKNDLQKASEEHEQLLICTDEIYQLKRDLADSVAAKMKNDAELDNLREEVQKVICKGFLIGLKMVDMLIMEFLVSTSL